MRTRATASASSQPTAIKSYGWNLLTEIIGTFVLIGWIIASGKTPSELYLAVALVVVSISMNLGGATGSAINPARDLYPVSPTPSCPSPVRPAPTGLTHGFRLLPIIGAILAY